MGQRGRCVVLEIQAARVVASRDKPEKVKVFLNLVFTPR